MDWIRRNWPDLLIGLALLAVIAGIIATLLNGGSFLGRSGTPSSPPAASATTQNATTDNTAESATTQNAATENAPVDASSDATTTDSQGVEVPSIDTAPIGEVPVDTDTVGADIPVISSADGAATPADTAATIAPSATPSEAATPATTPATIPASPAEVSTPSVSGVESAYRIVVGSFGNADNAQRRAQTFADAGFPAFTATQGDLTLALVGPFGSQSDAESAFNRIQSEGLESAPLLFTPAGNDGGTAASATDNGTTATSAAPSDTGSSVSVSGESYLQAGAYASSESAQPRREQLEALGFSVSEVQEGSLVKLLVGPFSAAELSAAQSRLSAQGIDYFVRSN